MLVKTLATIICLLAIAGCGGGGEGEPYELYCFSASRPVLSKVTLSQESALVGEGGGLIEVTVSVDYQQTDEWIFLILYHVYDSAGRLVTNSSDETHLNGVGTYSFPISIDTSKVETYRIAVTLSDRCGEVSHHIDSTFQVVQPAALVGKTEYGVARQGDLTFLVGGRDEDGAATSTVLSFDARSNRIEELSSLPEERAGAAAVMQNGRLYVLAGTAYGYPQNTTFIYDPLKGYWTAGSPMSQPAINARVTVVDGLLQVESGTHISCYDTVLDMWADVACGMD